MKFKIAIIDQDQLYLERMCRLFGEKYSDRLMIYSYSNIESFVEGRRVHRFDLALFAEGSAKAQDLPKDTPVAFLTTENDIDKIDDITAICKFQRHEVLFKQILDMCLERETRHYTKKNVFGNITKVLYVTAAKGGVGTTTIATAAAKHFAMSGRKVLYLSIEKNAVTDLFFTANEETNLSDVIYMLKSKKTNLISRVENIIQRDASGVFFFRQAKTVFDMNELSGEDIITLLKELCLMGSYEYIIVDGNFEYNQTGNFLCDFADEILLVSDGSVISGEKLNNLQTAIKIWDSTKGTRLQSKMKLVYNRFDTKTGIQPISLEFEIVGGTPKFEGAGENMISEQISTMSFWDNILN